MTPLDAQLRTLSDGMLYNLALELADEFEAAVGSRGVDDLKRAQLTALSGYSRKSRTALDNFVAHQLKRSTLPKVYQKFYQCLRAKLESVLYKAAEDSELIPAEIRADGTSRKGKKRLREEVDRVAGLFVVEFVEHLNAELMFRQKKVAT